jgi:hypothetical protein
MINKTEGVKILVQDVLRTISEPYGEDIILEVIKAIELNDDWKRQRHDELEYELSKGVVNQWVGKYTKDLTGLKIIRQVNAPEEWQHIVRSYTKLG